MSGVPGRRWNCGRAAQRLARRSDCSVRNAFPAILAAGLWFGGPLLATAQLVTFDFDTGSPTLGQYQNLPIDQTAGGITARFSGISGGFSVQTDLTTGYNLSQFSGKYLYPNQVRGNALQIQFNRELTDIVFTFATTENPDVEVPTPIIVTASSVTPSGTNAVGSATARGTYGADTFPMGTLAFNAGSKSFNRLEVRIQPGGDATFLLDNLTVSPVPELNIWVADPDGVVLAWAAPSTGFVLQQNSALDSTSWVNVAEPVEVVNGQNQVTIARATGIGFYRLFHP